MKVSQIGDAPTMRGRGWMPRKSENKIITWKKIIILFKLAWTAQITPFLCVPWYYTHLWFCFFYNPNKVKNHWFENLSKSLLSFSFCCHTNGEKNKEFSNPFYVVKIFFFYISIYCYVSLLFMHLCVFYKSSL